MSESDLLNEDFLDGKGGLRKDVQHDFEVVCADSNCRTYKMRLALLAEVAPI